MASYFSPEALDMLDNTRRDIRHKHAALSIDYINRGYLTDIARKYALHGFCRRLGTLVRAIDIVFDVLPPELELIPERNDVEDATIAIQSFVTNIFGCLDNLAWIFVHERNIKNKDGTDLDCKRVGLGVANKDVRSKCSGEFLKYLYSRSAWFSHIKFFRDSLAHRMPLYIPPYVVPTQKSDEYRRLELACIEALSAADINQMRVSQVKQQSICVFRPWMVHSEYDELPTVQFHPQLLQDYVTIDEFGRQMLDELGR